MAKMLKIVWYLQNKNFLKVLTVILFQVLQLYMSCQNKMGFPVEIVWLEFKKMMYEKQVEKKLMWWKNWGKGKSELLTLE